MVRQPRGYLIGGKVSARTAKEEGYLDCPLGN